MAGPVLNLTIFNKSRAHALRAISVITFPPGFFFLLISGITSGRVNPAISSVPLFFSSAFGVFLLANEKQCGCPSSGLTGTPIHLLVDFGVGASILVCLILTWVFLPRSYRGGDIMLGTYCTNFLITNFLIHLYFVVQELYRTVMPGAVRQSPTSCPQCLNRYGPFAQAIRNAAKGGYAPLLDGEGEPNSDPEGRTAEQQA